MEHEFDKEIDALLRKTAKSGAAAVPVIDPHIDADEISMFAENALPDSARMRVVSHMADCDRCRIILANVIDLNAEADAVPPVMPASAEETIVAADRPASRLSGLFTTKNLAFGFGALALLFAGFIGFAVIQNLNSGGTDLAQADSNEINAPARESSEAFSANSTNTADADAEEPAPDSEDRIGDEKAAAAQPIMEADNSAVSGKDAVRQAKTKPADDAFADKGDLSGRRDNKVVSAGSMAKEQEDAATDVVSEAQPPPPVVAAPTTAPAKRKLSVITPRSGVTRSRAESKKKEKNEKDMDGAVAAADESPAKRTINGKTFTRRNGAWYDSAYKNQPTRNIKRGTSEFYSLDAGVRTIATKLSGTIVVVWKTKALKIQ